MQRGVTKDIGARTAGYRVIEVDILIDEFVATQLKTGIHNPAKSKPSNMQENILPPLKCLSAFSKQAFECRY